MKAKATSDRGKKVIRRRVSAMTYRRGEIMQLNGKHSGSIDEKES